MRIAVIDDDESVRRSLLRLLRLSGFQAAAFHSAEEFLGSPVRDTFECLVIDVQLRAGCMSGLEFQRRLVSAGKLIPIVFLTAHDDSEIEAEANRQGCAGFLYKGSPPRFLLDRLVAIERREAVKLAT